MSGLVVFRLGDREYATALTSVREVVRLEGLVDLPGMTPPLAGVLDLRGTALPVLDLRPAAVPGARGDVLVLQEQVDTGTGGAVVGVAVDAVRAVVTEEELPGAGAAEAAVGRAGSGAWAAEAAHPVKHTAATETPNQLRMPAPVSPAGEQAPSCAELSIASRA